MCMCALYLLLECQSIKLCIATMKKSNYAAGEQSNKCAVVIIVVTVIFNNASLFSSAFSIFQSKYWLMERNVYKGFIKKNRV